MDGLLAEVAAKRKAITTESDRPKKYMRRGDIERLKEEEERKAKEEKEAKARAEKEAAEAVERAKVAKLKVCSFPANITAILSDLLMENRPLQDQLPIRHILVAL